MLASIFAKFHIESKFKMLSLTTRQTIKHSVYLR